MSSTSLAPLVENDVLTTEGPVRRALVVDDDEGIRRFASRALAVAGYDVQIACDGEDAMRLIDAQRRFDLFVFDVVMPGMRGDELAERLYRRDPGIIVLYFTGYAERLFGARPVLREREMVIEKPIAMSAFLAAVSRLLPDDPDEVA